MMNNQSMSDSTDGFSAMAYDITFAVGFVLIVLLILTACCIWSRSETRAARGRLLGITTGRGIDEAVLSSYPKLSYSKAKLERAGESPIGSGCSICLVDYKESDTLRSLPGCGHLFHVKCVDPWLRMHSTCPICRTTPGPVIGVSIPEAEPNPRSR